MQVYANILVILIPSCAIYWSNFLLRVDWYKTKLYVYLIMEITVVKWIEINVRKSSVYVPVNCFRFGGIDTCYLFSGKEEKTTQPRRTL